MGVPLSDLIIKTPETMQNVKRLWASVIPFLYTYNFMKIKRINEKINYMKKNGNMNDPLRLLLEINLLN